MQPPLLLGHVPAVEQGGRLAALPPGVPRIGRVDRGEGLFERGHRVHGLPGSSAASSRSTLRSAMRAVFVSMVTP